MATLGSDPRYRPLAATAASILGSSSPSIVNAILGQWQCEQPGGPPWPPVHNNPGFVTIGAIRSVGITAGAYATTSPGVGFLAQFGSPAEGASAYAQLLARGARYKDARAAIAAGDGAKFLEKVTAAGYGTRYSCAINAYRALGGAAAGGTISPAPGATLAATGGLLEEWLARISRQASDPVRAEDVVPFVQFLVEKKLVPPGGGSNPVTSSVRRQIELAVGKPWSAVGQQLLDAAAQEDPFGLGAVFDGIAAAIGDASFTFVVLGAIAVLLLMGVWRLTR